MKIVYRFIFLTFLLLLVSNCARTGRPEGGPKDETAPLFVTANPPHKSVKFNTDEIKINFNEYVRLKDINKQLVISPPMKNPPLISPQGSPSEFLKIKILDTLKANTTYIFNFGNAIEDNNEGNKLENFKYVFSTGSYIDSLKSSGFVKGVNKKEDIKNINILLYKLDTSFNDSIIYKNKPSYVTNTLDTTLFKFTNLKEGKYLMLALKEPTSDYIFNPKTDQIGFLKDTIQLPRDSIVTKPIVLFKEEQPFKFRRGKEVSKGKIQFGFEGKRDSLHIKLISKVSDSFKSVSKYELKKDTLNYWFTPNNLDSLNFIISRKEFADTITVKLRKKQLDSLIINPSVKKTLHFRDTFFLNTNNPINKIDTTKVKLFEADTIPIKYNIINSKKLNKLGILFDKKPESNYNIKLMPNAISDIYAIKNDTLDYKLSTKAIDDYGSITLNINNVKSKNLIIEILTGKNQDELVERKFITTSTKVVFDLLEPQKYTIRVIVDENKNNKWDTGSYLQKLHPEKIIYHEAINNYDLRANFFLIENFTIN